MENKVMLMIDALKDGFNRFADFSGVSSRSQYWYFILGTTIATVIAQVAFGDFGGNLVSIITLLPTIAVAVRRMLVSDAKIRVQKELENSQRN